MRARKWSRVQRRRTKFGRELAMLHDGEPLAAVVRSFCGRCRAGDAAVDRWMATLEAAYDHDKPRRALLIMFLRMWEHARLNARTGQWRVVDKHGFVGNRHFAPEVVRDDAGNPRMRPNRAGVMVPWVRRRHMPGKLAGGLSAGLERAPRTLDAYKRVLRAGGIIQTQRTTRNMADAVLPLKDSSFWGYSQIWLRDKPPAEFLRRLQGYTPPRYPPRQRQTPPANPGPVKPCTSAGGAGGLSPPPAN